MGVEQHWAERFTEVFATTARPQATANTTRLVQRFLEQFGHGQHDVRSIKQPEFGDQLIGNAARFVVGQWRRRVVRWGGGGGGEAAAGKPSARAEMS